MSGGTSADASYARLLHGSSSGWPARAARPPPGPGSGLAPDMLKFLTHKLRTHSLNEEPAGTKVRAAAVPANGRRANRQRAPREPAHRALRFGCPSSLSLFSHSPFHCERFGVQFVTVRRLFVGENAYWSGPCENGRPLCTRAGPGGGWRELFIGCRSRNTTPALNRTTRRNETKVSTLLLHTDCYTHNSPAPQTLPFYRHIFTSLTPKYLHCIDRQKKRW